MPAWRFCPPLSSAAPAASRAASHAAGPAAIRSSIEAMPSVATAAMRSPRRQRAGARRLSGARSASLEASLPRTARASLSTRHCHRASLCKTAQRAHDKLSAHGVLARRRRGGLLHPGRAAHARLAALALAAGPGAREGGRWRSARAAAALGSADGRREGVPAARSGRRACGRAGAAGGALGARPRDGRARDQHRPLDRGGDPARPRAVVAPAPARDVRPAARVHAPLAGGGLCARGRWRSRYRPAAHRLVRSGSPARLGGVPRGALAGGSACLPPEAAPGRAQGPRLGDVRARQRPARPHRQRLRVGRVHASARGVDFTGGDGRPAGSRGRRPDARAGERDPRRTRRQPWFASIRPSAARSRSTPASSGGRLAAPSST